MDIFAQRLDSNGVRQWGSGGVTICSFDNIRIRAISDGAGGVIIAWEDARNIDTTQMDIYAQRIKHDGSVPWMNNGVPVCTAPRQQFNITMTTDSAQGAILAWTDRRVYGEEHIYASRLTSSGILLPLELTTFIASPSLDGVELSWTTAAERGLAVFEIERAKSGEWSVIAAVNAEGGNGTNRYRFLDASPPAGMVHYRLKMLETDGSVEYSNVVTVERGPAAEPLAVFAVAPNPVHDQAVISYANASPCEVTVEVCDALGRTVAVIEHGPKEAGYHTALFMPGRLPPGGYIARVRTALATRYAKMLLVR